MENKKCSPVGIQAVKVPNKNPYEIENVEQFGLVVEDVTKQKIEEGIDNILFMTEQLDVNERERLNRDITNYIMKLLYNEI